MQSQQKIHHRTETADNFCYKNNGGVSLTAEELERLFEDSHRHVERLLSGDFWWVSPKRHKGMAVIHKRNRQAIKPPRDHHFIRVNPNSYEARILNGLLEEENK